MNGSPLGPGISLKGLAVPVVLKPFSPVEWGDELVNLGKEWRATSAILRLMKYIISFEATPFAACEDEHVFTQLGTKEFIHCVHCVNHTLRLVASKEADL